MASAPSRTQVDALDGRGARPLTDAGGRPDGPAPGGLVDDRLQGAMLQEVSRTFALTIPVLPEDLRCVVGNAYLLCRIVDTVEDEPALTGGERARFSSDFVRVIAGDLDARRFADELAPLLSEATLPAVRELIRRTPYVVSITRSFDERQRRAIERCVAIMAEGMVEFQADDGCVGLPDQRAMDRYCYHVAGVVGELLTELFCLHVPELQPRRGKMMALSRSFGQGLQMTNILKDVWDDLERGACWLPRSVFAEAGLDLSDLRTERGGPAFDQGLSELIGVAHGHLANALDYTLRIPSSQTGIRTFCLWTLGMAILTLRRIHRNRSYTSGDQVKISRRSVRTMATLSRVSARRAPMVRALFAGAGLGIPRTAVEIDAAV